MTLTHPDDLEKSERLLEKHFNGEIEYYECECRMRHKNGEWVWVLDRGMVVAWDEQGRPLRMAGTHTDISARKKVEAEIESFQHELEQRVEERTRELREAQSHLLMQEKMASVGQLAAGIAHELNNPINFVRTNFAALFNDFADIAAIIQTYRHFLTEQERSQGTSPETEHVRAMEKNLHIGMILDDIPDMFEESDRGFDRITKIIQSMRDFSHVDQHGRMIFYDINKGIEDTLVIARNVYKYDADIVLDLGKLSEIKCFPEQMNQVFLNLVVNSAQAISSMKRAGRGVITIKTWQKNGYTFCSVADNGPGIPADIRSRIFEPFYTTKVAGQGTGLGLSISYDIIVSKHRGSIEVSCPEEGGTVFTMCLPNDLPADGEENETQR